MRHRELITPTETVNGYWTQIRLDNFSVLSQVLKTYTPSISKVMDDVVTPNFRKLSRNGAIINNPMTLRTTELTRDGITGSYDTRYVSHGNHRDYGTTWDSAWYPPFLAAPTLDEADMKLLAGTRAWANVTSSEASSIVTLVEAKETVKGTVEIIKRLLKWIRLVRRHRFRELAGEFTPRQIANYWLEVRYGIRPLFYDMRDILNALRFRETRKIGDRQTFRGYEVAEATTTGTVEHFFGSFQKYLWNRSTKSSVRVRAGVLCQLENLSNQAEIWGLYDLPQAVVDLTTFSFVVGWFFNVADTVAAWTPSYSWRPKASWTVVEKTTFSAVVQGSLTWSDPVAFLGGGVSGGGNYQKVVEVIRIPEATRNIIPRFNLNLDTSKLIDLVALAKTNFSAIPRMRRF